MLRPPDGKVHVVRWIRDDGRAAQQKFYRRRSDALLWQARMALVGKRTATFVATVTWEPAGDPDPVEFRTAQRRLNVREAKQRLREGRIR